MAANDYMMVVLEKRVDGLYALQPAVQVQRIDDLVDDMRDLKADMRGMRRALYTFAASLLLAAIMITIVAWSSGRIHG